jgi:membrane-bound lytic murein transglycosylase D
MRGLLVALFAVGSTAQAAPAAAPGEDAAGRRAIRGKSVDNTHELEELKQLREFESESFPRSPPPPLDDRGPAPARAALTGGLGPDALPPELRSPEPAHADAPAAPAMPWLDGLKLPDLPVRLDPRVLRYLEFYKSDARGRAIMASWLRKQGRWRPLLEDALRRANLPLALVYVCMIESGYDPHDRSRAGAVGLWQFMPEGGRIYGLRIDYWIDERKDPERSTEAAMRYLGDLKERFGAWPLALAAFNAGYGAVLRAMQKYNTNDYFELSRHEDGLPWETVLYVPKVMAAALVGDNRARFGYDNLPSEEPYAFERVDVPSSTSLAAIARSAGVTPSEVSALNPELRRGRTPPEPWSLRLPRGSAARFVAAYPAHRELVKPVVARFGERLDDLARAAGISLHELRVLNGVDDSAEIRPGVVLLLPDGPRPPVPPPCETVLVAVPDKDAVVPDRKRIFYRTLPQDSLDEIAAFFKVRAADLAHWNHVDLEAKLASGMVLQLFVAPDFDTSKAALVDAARVRVVTAGSDEFFDLVEAQRGRARLVYTVKSGDDLKRIGKRYGLTVADLERINRFGARHTDLTVGQKLIVYRTMTAREKAEAACKLTPGGVAAPAAAPVEDSPVDAEAADPLTRTLPRPPPPDEQL